MTTEGVDLVSDDGALPTAGGVDDAPAVRRDLHLHAHRGRGGRPRDPGATVRVVAAAQSLLAERGPGVAVEAVAARAGVGKATIYRRWSTTAGLYADAVLATDPLPAAPCTEAPRTAEAARALLVALLQRLTEALAPAELTVAAALSQVTVEPDLMRAVEHVLLAPLRARVRQACGQPGAADDPGLAAAVALVEGLWVRRYLRAGPLLTASEVGAVVDDVLLARAPWPVATRP